ncbi:DUF3306 domain-containing protein [Phaeobacter gallaeciensis]|uniref:DUF3306 domain-containing protein n=1 Tax=Phaeobacter gallaeciensis TaxID=60890 RepID=A0AAD0EAB4_9RHOB|nr:DUF3306 domain-containing protein [Phaeobacter gallaeciensis]AHD08443.1 hypothetical protein Gal_00658 [Phaeobacter gallaeciensis DSM 26640]ATE91709.1 hypothetical protein PhaeoP11_00654 [Phaeobacter gallaeciensis]ATE98467.1 hypothetical protein PhaeoP73_03190 [Phaeobacter gallaeciensis]ATF00325.1 hypothetical protein PhaeoP75_00655 [Phaeobacter gallaeciensis]ATF04757.1 hypothetical protein PhaeoP63_00655 [Phaeobacter gallaeciensis]
MSGGDFWSQRRAKVAAEQQAEAVEAAALARAAEERALEEKSDAELLEELNLPDPDQMQQGDDFSVFLKETIPARLRTRALRRLWTSNPVLANVDGLLDYGEDFTDSAMVVENLQTAYQVGKGMTAHVEELARQAEEAAGPPSDVLADTEGAGASGEKTASAGEDAAAADKSVDAVRRPTMRLLSPADADDAELPTQEEVATTIRTDDARPDPAAPDPLAPDPVAPAPRRMRFTFAADPDAPAA